MRTEYSTDALELLTAQHEEVESLLEEIEAEEEPDQRAMLFQEFADQMAAHSTIEEKIFYPAVMDASTREQLIEATEEHLSVKRLIADLMLLEPDNEHFDAKLTVLKEQISHHAHEEEEDALFPKVRKMFDKEELAALGGEMLAMFERLLEDAPREGVPAETHEAAPLP